MMKAPGMFDIGQRFFGALLPSSLLPFGNERLPRAVLK